MEYKSLNPSTMLAPVPAVMVSCRGTEENAAPNIITLAWVGTVNSEPPMVSISVRKERHSYGLIRESGEFVVNVVDEPLCKALDYSGVKSGRDVNKFEACGLTPVYVPELQYAPAIDGAPIQLLCKTRQVLELGSHDMFIGEIIGVRVRGDLMHEDGSMHLEGKKLVMYEHGLYHEMGKVLGFFGYSVARHEVFERRMKSLD